MKTHPVPRLTIAGGFAKLTKFAQGANDLHSGRSEVDLTALAELSGAPDRLAEARTAKHALELARQAEINLAGRIATLGQQRAAELLDGSGIEVGLLITDRQGNIVAEA